MAYIITPRFAPVYQAPQCSPFGFYAPRSQPNYACRTVHRTKPQPQSQSRPSPFASFFNQLDELVNEIDSESQRQAQIEAQHEAQRVAHIEAQRAAQIKAHHEAYQAHIEAQQAAYRQRQAQIEAYIEAQHEAHRQQQLRERASRPNFTVAQNEQGWQVDAEVLGFKQHNINIEVTDDNTLKITGNTGRDSETLTETQSEVEVAPAVKHAEETTIEQKAEDNIEDMMLEPEAETAATTAGTNETESIRSNTPDSDTASQKSYQATVEEDFEDLGPEASTLFSTSVAPTTPTEPKGQEKAAESPIHHSESVEDPEISVPTEAAISQQPHPDIPAQQQHEQRPHRYFERTLKFPDRIDASNVRASFKEGVLSISVPRAQVQYARRIAIL